LDCDIITLISLLTWDGWDDDFVPWRAEFDKEKDLFGFPYAETGGYADF
jgi:hypothetical protein